MVTKRNTEEQRARAKEYDKKWYEANRDKRLAITRRWEEANIAKYNEYKKSLKCIHCGESNHLVLQFHHPDLEKKEFAISTKRRNHSFEKLMIEINKCLVLCANCHILEHNKLKLKNLT